MEEEKPSSRGGDRAYDEESMDAALGRVWAAYERDGKLPNLVALGKELSVPVTTLRRYVKLSYRSIEEVPPSHRPSLLTEEQERKVAVWICIMSACGKSVTRKEIDSHIYDMLTLEGTPPKRIQRSADWWQGFDARWPSLGLRRGQSSNEHGPSTRTSTKSAGCSTSWNARSQSSSQGVFGIAMSRVSQPGQQRVVGWCTGFAAAKKLT
jgi:hypothetical protein